MQYKGFQATANTNTAPGALHGTIVDAAGYSTGSVEVAVTAAFAQAFRRIVNQRPTRGIG